MEVVFDNEPSRANANELFEPDNPFRRPAVEMSWQGKPAVSIKPSAEQS